MFKDFANRRLIEGQNKAFWDPLPRKAVLTFADMKKPLTNDNKKKFHINTEVLFRRLLAVSKHCNIDLKMVLSYELAGVPPSLFHDDGAMRKTNKADLANKSETNCEEISGLRTVSEDVPPSAYIIDGMGMIQALNEDYFKTFDGLAEVILKRLVRILKNLSYECQTVTIVFDR